MGACTCVAQLVAILRSVDVHRVHGASGLRADIMVVAMDAGNPAALIAAGGLAYLSKGSSARPSIFGPQVILAFVRRAVEWALSGDVRCFSLMVHSLSLYALGILLVVLVEQARSNLQHSALGKPETRGRA